MSTSTSAIKINNPGCDCEEWMRGACDSSRPLMQSGPKNFCVLHHPSVDKKKEFKLAFDEKLTNREFDFTGVWFPSEVIFSDQSLVEASFRDANFNAKAHFRRTDFGKYVDFRGAKFLEAGFNSAKFVTGDFAKASFGNVDFIGAAFERGYFSNAHFKGDAFFNPATFRERANFGEAEFHGKAYFGEAQFTAAFFGGAKFTGLADFGEARFASVNFGKAQIANRVNFAGASFGGTAVFEEAQFDEADFTKANFAGDVLFGWTKIGDADFTEATMSNADFKNVEFSRRASFCGTKFRSSASKTAAPSPLKENEKPRITFENARFKDSLIFEDCDLENVMLHFAAATAEQPGRITFHNLTLRPIWLSRFDSRSLQFIKVRWRDLRKRTLVASEIRGFEQQNIRTPYESLEIVSRQLAFNAEENNRYDDAARFRFVANEARRRATWRQLKAEPLSGNSWLNLQPLLWLYWAVSGYGERAWQAAFVLLILCILFASIFFFGQRSGGWWQPTETQAEEKLLGPKTGDVQTATSELTGFGEALVYSANVIALQKPEPLPANKKAKVFVLIETFLGPIQLALLALAIRRKFMR